MRLVFHSLKSIKVQQGGEIEDNVKARRIFSGFRVCVD